MAESASSLTLLRLMSWLSPAFPVGSFAYSHGLERAIHDGLIGDRASLADWLTTLIEMGSGWNDGVLLAEAWRDGGAGGDGAEVAELGEAMAGSSERHMETMLQGEAFRDAVGNWDATRASPSPWGGGGNGNSTQPLVGLAARPSPQLPDSTITPPLPPPHKGEGNVLQMPYPVAVGLAAARHGIPLEPALTAYLHAFASNLIQAAVRLVPLGQRDGVAALASLEPIVLQTANRAATSTRDDLGSCTIMSEIMSMKHEIQYSRVFRS